MIYRYKKWINWQFNYWMKCFSMLLITDSILLGQLVCEKEPCFFIIGKSHCSKDASNIWYHSSWTLVKFSSSNPAALDFVFETGFAQKNITWNSAADWTDRRFGTATFSLNTARRASKNIIVNPGRAILCVNRRVEINSPRMFWRFLKNRAKLRKFYEDEMIHKRPIFHSTIVLFFFLIAKWLKIAVKVTSFSALRFKKKGKKGKGERLVLLFPFFSLTEVFLLLPLARNFRRFFLKLN